MRMKNFPQFSKNAFRPKKRLGQNFLVDPRARERMIEACAFSSDDIVLEIAPAAV